MRVILVALLLFSLAQAAIAQFPPSDQNVIQAGAGVTWINNQPFYSVRFRPEVAFSNIGIGLDLNLDFDANGNLRKENFNEFSDYASIIRYIRYGKERDPFYAKLGALDYSTIGHGTIIGAYNNSPSFDTRKIGLQLNFNGDNYGVQALYGNFGQAGVAGVRPYVHPLKFTSLADVPIIGGFEVGATYAGDFDKYAKVTGVTFYPAPPYPTGVVFPDSSSGQPTNSVPYSAQTNGALSIFGFDMGFPIVRGDFASLVLYADYVKIVDFGEGAATGLMLNIDGIPLLSIAAKLERRFDGEHYLPTYFNSLYEIERFNTSTFSAKSRLLADAIPSNGTYGDLLVRVLNMFDIFGSYQKLDKINHSGILHLFTDIAPKDAPVVARAGYDKTNIIDLTDLVTTDDRSFLYAELGYKPYPFLIVSTVYMWTYTPIRNGGDVVGYEPQRRIEPKVAFVYTF